MGDIQLQCPACDTTLVVDEEGAGLTVPCPVCNFQVTLPGALSPSYQSLPEGVLPEPEASTLEAASTENAALNQNEAELDVASHENAESARASEFIDSQTLRNKEVLEYLFSTPPVKPVDKKAAESTEIQRPTFPPHQEEKCTPDDKVEVRAAPERPQQVHASPGAPDPAAAFVSLFKERTLSYLIANLDSSLLHWDKREAFRARLIELLDECLRAERIPIGRNLRERLIAEIVDEMVGLGPLEALMKDVEVSEIVVQDPAKIMIERRGSASLAAPVLRIKTISTKYSIASSATAEKTAARAPSASPYQPLTLGPKSSSRTSRKRNRQPLCSFASHCRSGAWAIWPSKHNPSA